MVGTLGLAATTASRLGMKAAVITFSKNDIGTLSCNPAMGGLEGPPY